MKRIAFHDGWSYRIWGVPGEGRPVSLPHDYSMSLPRSRDARSGSAGGFYQCENIIYDRTLHVTGEMLRERVILEFEGVMANAQVYLDDVLVAKQYCGYTTFHADLTPYLHEGVQKLRVNTANDAQPCSRWYTGCGIYRPVWLLRAPMACIVPWGLQVVTRRQTGGWQAQIDVRVSQEACQPDAAIRCRISDEKERYVAEAIMPLSGTQMTMTIPVENAQPWSPDAPTLYVCTAELLLAGKTADSETTRFGFRTVGLDAKQGLSLNGEPIKLRGGCVHHDNGLLGAVSHEDAEYRKARLLKENGFNAVRCAHNPPAPAFLDACDRLGLLVMDEFTDVWNIGKNPYDYHLFFQEHWRDDLRAMVMRDRNHPSVILWSIGNEIPERDGSGQGYSLSRQLSDEIRLLDDTRLITAGLNNIGKRRLEMLDANLQSVNADEIDYFGELSREFLEPLDVAGYNYLGHRYEKDMKTFPQRFFCGTESVAKESYLYWQLVQKHPRVIGDFAWAAIGYLGECGIGHVWYNPEDGQGYFERYPWRFANCADIDMLGRKRPCSYYRDAVWGRLDAPCIAVQHPAHYREDGDVSYWAWPERFLFWDYPGFEGKPIQVEVYSAAESVTLMLNGVRIGSKVCRECRATFELTYQPGELTALDADGKLRTLHTPGTPRSLSLTADKDSYDRADRLIYLTARIVDEEGNECANDHRQIRFEVTGGELLAVGSANPASEESFLASAAECWNGCVGAVIRTGEAQNVTVAAHAEGLEGCRMQLIRFPN